MCCIEETHHCKVTLLVDHCLLVDLFGVRSRYERGYGGCGPWNLRDRGRILFEETGYQWDKDRFIVMRALAEPWGH